MKKFGLVAVLLVISATFAFAVDPVPGTSPITSDEGSLILNATVQKFIDLNIVASGNNFTLTADGLSAHEVGVATFKSNYKKWLVQVKSTSGSFLVRDTADDPEGATMTEKIAYTFAFVKGTGAHDWPTTYVALPTNYPATAGAGYYAQTGKTIIAGEAVSMKINIAAQDTSTFWDGGSYTDTISVQISAN